MRRARTSRSRPRTTTMTSAGFLWRQTRRAAAQHIATTALAGWRRLMKAIPGRSQPTARPPTTAAGYPGRGGRRMPRGCTHYETDRMGRTTDVSVPSADPDSAAPLVHYSFNLLGRIEAVTSYRDTGAGRTTSYTYNRLGQQRRSSTRMTPRRKTGWPTRSSTIMRAAR